MADQSLLHNSSQVYKSISTHRKQGLNKAASLQTAPTGDSKNQLAFLNRNSSLGMTEQSKTPKSCEFSSSNPHIIVPYSKVSFEEKGRWESWLYNIFSKSLQTKQTDPPKIFQKLLGLSSILKLQCLGNLFQGLGGGVRGSRLDGKISHLNWTTTKQVHLFKPSTPSAQEAKVGGSLHLR